MSVKLIEQHTGRGDVLFEDRLLATVEYRLDVFAESDAGAVTEKEVIGQISSHPAMPFESLLTLRLQDGQKINFYLKSILHDVSMIATTGPFYV